ncbi:MAG TPA: tetratricopeptide repeat protein [Nitrospiria bacterium]|nr:tetratricopeptide repeat protein [Nitrospiria bacterium]
MMTRIAWAVLLTAVIGAYPVFADELFDAETAKRHFNTGLELYFKQDYKNAIKEFETATEIDPENANAYYFMGYSYYKLKDMKKAMEVFDQAYDANTKYSPIRKTSTNEPLPGPE